MELETYSVLINWDDDDDKQGTYGATVRAPDHDEAEAIARSMMRATGEGSWPFGSVVDSQEGALWAASDLEKALRAVRQRLVDRWKMRGNMPGDANETLALELETMVHSFDEIAGPALKRCEPKGPAWGTLHWDGGTEPDWTKFAYLEIDGCVQDDSDTDDIHVNAGHPDDKAEFWTIYGREKDTGFAQAIQDCVSRREADHVLKLMMARSGLPGYRVGEEMPEGIVRLDGFMLDAGHAIDAEHVVFSVAGDSMDHPRNVTGKSPGHDWVFFFRDGDEPEILSGSVYRVMTMEKAVSEARFSIDPLGNDPDYELLGVIRHDATGALQK